MPILAGFALYFLLVRINQYGFTLERLIGLLAYLVILAYALAYSFTIFKSETWLAHIKQSNIYISYLILSLIVLINETISHLKSS